MQKQIEETRTISKIEICLTIWLALSNENEEEQKPHT